MSIRAPRTTAATLIGLALFAVPALAQECELRVRMAQGATSSNLMPAETFTLSAGETREITRNYMREATNEGGNDIVITLDLAGVQTVHTLVDTDAGTAIFPPLAWASQQLVNVECGEHATYRDAEDYLDEFGSSANTLYSTALADATAAVNAARDEALEVFDAEQVAGWVAQVEPFAGEVQEAWAELQGYADKGVTPRELTMDADFPELAAAFEATEAYGEGFEPRLASGLERLAVLQQDIAAFRDEYMGSGATGPFEFDLATSFPELAAFSDVSCRLNTRPVIEASTQVAGLVQALETLDERFGFSEGVARVAELPAEFAALMEYTAANNWCDGSFEDIAEAAEADFTALDAWNERLLATHRRLARTQRFLQQRERTALRDAYREYAEANANRRQVRRQYGRSTVSYRRAVRTLRERDATTMERRSALRTIRRHRTLQNRMRQADRDYVAARRQLSQERSGLARVLRGRRATTRAQEAYRNVLNDAPQPTLDDRLVEAVGECIEDLAPYVDAAARALESFSPPDLPQAVAAALNQVRSASRSLVGALTPTAESVRGVATAYRQVDRPATRGRVVTMGRQRVLVFPDPNMLAESARDPWGALNGGLEELGDRLNASNRRFVDATAAFAAQYAEDDAEWEAFAKANAALAAAVRAEGRDLSGEVRDVATQARNVVRLRADIDGTMAEIEECEETLGAAVGSITKSLESRAAAYRELVENALSPELPESVVTALDRVAADAAAAHAAVAEAHLYYGVENAKNHEKFGPGFLGVILLPLAQPLHWFGLIDFPAEYSAAEESMLQGIQGFVASAPGLAERLNTVAATHGALAKSLTGLADASTTEFGAAVTGSAQAEMARALADMTYTELDAAMVEEETARVESLAAAWTTAIGAAPTRAAEIAPVLIANEIDKIRTNVMNGLDDLAERHATLQQCYASGRDSMSPIEDVQLTITVAEAAAGAVQDNAEDVISSLESLLQPTANLLPDVPSILEAAAALSDLLAAVGQTAAEAYANEIESDRDDAEDARQCAAQAHFPMSEQRASLLEAISTTQATVEELAAALTGRTR